MRNLILYIILVSILTACRNQAVERPSCINKKGSLTFPKGSLVFLATGKHWKATLQSFTQHIPLKLRYTKEGFILYPENDFGITEGLAKLILSNESQTFYYELNLINDSYGNIYDKDYRSPKTVNPDSGLSQHRILHSIDEWRNILIAPGQLNPFYEDIIELGPNAGTFRAQKEKPLTSFFVQPGSCTSIDVKSDFVNDENIFLVTAGPLKDKYNNLAANGTMVAFIYSNSEQIFRTEAALLNGFATIKIPAEQNKTYRLTARVNETVSKQIQLVP